MAPRTTPVAVTTIEDSEIPNAITLPGADGLQSFVPAEDQYNDAQELRAQTLTVYLDREGNYTVYAARETVAQENGTVERGARYFDTLSNFLSSIPFPATTPVCIVVNWKAFNLLRHGQYEGPINGPYKESADLLVATYQGLRSQAEVWVQGAQWDTINAALTGNRTLRPAPRRA